MDWQLRSPGDRYPIRGTFFGCWPFATAARVTSPAATNVNDQPPLFIAHLVCMDIYHASDLLGARKTRFIDRKTRHGLKLNCKARQSGSPVDSPLGAAIRVRHHVQVYRSILPPMPRRFLGRNKPDATFQWRVPNQFILCSMRISLGRLAGDRGAKAIGHRLSRQNPKGCPVMDRYLLKLSSLSWVYNGCGSSAL